METHSRSIAKTLTWRAVSLVLIIAITWAFTRRLSVAASVGIADLLLKSGLYYAHERVWGRINFGRSPAEDYEI